MGGAGLAEGLSLVVVNAVADSHDERFDQCSRGTDSREFPQPPGERVPDPSRVERAGRPHPPVPGVVGPNVSLARVAVPEQPGLVVESARVPKPSRGPESDHEPPGLPGDEFREISSRVRVPRETQTARPDWEAGLHGEVEPGAVGSDGRDRGDSPGQDDVLAGERGRHAGRDGRMGMQQRPQESDRAPARGCPAARGREVQGHRKQRGGPQAGQRLERVQDAGAEQEGDRP